MKKLLAAFIFFTRIPIGKKVNIPVQYYKDIVGLWAFTGVFTGGIMALTVWGASAIMPFPLSVVLAFAVRTIITGALHEDGLSDFLDGFGGRSDRERTLAIMKDSHTGSYAIIGLILYYLLLILSVVSLGKKLAILALISADPVCKFIASRIVNILPYARNEEEAKAKQKYNRISPVNTLISAALSVLLILLFIPYKMMPALIIPVILFFILTGIMRRKIGGYTGDCCGALFLLCELSLYIGLSIMTTIL